MAYLSVPTSKGDIFQVDKSVAKILERKRAQKAEEYINRVTRESYLDDDDKVRLNVGGEIFLTRKATLRNVPKTKLANLHETDENYDKIKHEYFFDRNPFLFGYILDYYRTGSMHIPRSVCSSAIQKELKFWELGDGCITECCQKIYFDQLRDYTTYELIKDEFYSIPKTSLSSTDVGLSYSRWKEFKRQAWDLIDNLESSTWAKVFAVFYYGLIVATVANLFVATIPPLREPLRKHVLIRGTDDSPPPYNYGNNVTGTMKTLLTTEPPDWSVLIDFICLLFFSLEFLFRLLVCPSLSNHFKNWLTVIDLLYLLPAWTKLMIDLTSPFYWHQGPANVNLRIALDAMVVLRVFRIFRVFRHYRGMWVLMLAIKASVSELLLLVVFVVFSLTIYASLVFSVEQYNSNSDLGERTFLSMFTGLWWALITLTTVGYGDVFPMTVLGRIIACFCAITGLLIIGMVVPIISSNFQLYYGFRHAGCEEIEFSKPEFVPTEKENPVPDLEIEGYKPRSRRPSYAVDSDTMLKLARSNVDTSQTNMIKGGHGNFLVIPVDSNLNLAAIREGLKISEEEETDVKDDTVSVSV